MAKQEVYYGTGRRKTAIAKVWIKKGAGTLTINAKPIELYLNRDTLVKEAVKPLVVVNLKDKIDVKCLTLGGGIAAQAGAFAHGLARALVKLSEDHRKPLKAADQLRRDPRMKERKKYGRKRARRGFQFTKR